MKSGLFTNGAPILCSVTGCPMAYGTDAPTFVRRRREVLANALASTTLGIRQQMDPFEMDFRKWR